MTIKAECVVLKKRDTIRTLKARLRQKQQRAAIVMSDDGRSLAGIITATDLYYAADDDLIGDYYHKELTTILRTDPVGKALQALNSNHVHQLVVIDSEYMPLGILWDFMAVLGCPDEEPPTRRRTRASTTR
ncbi:MAG: CBS domain-containing protein [Anaerolineae bacterium]|nr:CBS domain-containing protein [Anaerolineae bacterium]